MNTAEQKAEVLKMKKIDPVYLIGTKAYHQLGDISRDVEYLLLAVGETEKFWVGMWVTGFGFFNVIFPKETTRQLTAEEVEIYNNKYVGVGSNPPIKLKVS